MKVITNNILSRLYAFLGECQEFVLLDTSKPDETNRHSLLFTRPAARLQFREGEDVAGFFQTLEDYRGKGYYLAGWFAYEFGYLLEHRLKPLLRRNEDRSTLLADVGVFADCSFFDHRSGVTDFPLASRPESLNDDYRLKNVRLTQAEAEYVEALEKILAYIEAGDTYQVNYTLKLLFDFSGSVERFYQDLRRNQSVGYGAYIRWQDQRILSFSPELFFRKEAARVTVRPMKGTVKRGRTLAEDENNRCFLQTDVKNKSENVMIVDLLRNDLGRLMHHVSGGDVRVDSLFDIETYETLLQMTSTITGSSGDGALAGVTLFELFKALFPCGSVTGAPKIRTMEIIDELEKYRRGVYTGAIGYVLPQGDAAFNVPIRTVVLDGAKGEMGIGSGIVHDSDPRQEWQECLLKGRFLTSPRPAFALIETLLWRKSSGYFLLDEHLRRLQDSARFFLFSYVPAEMKSALKKAAADFRAVNVRVRLLLEKDGSFRIASEACAAPERLLLPEKPEEPRGPLPSVALSERKIDSSSLWLHHKTTQRMLYDEEFEQAQNTQLFDVIFTNEHGHVTEGCITNVVVYDGSRYMTPPLADGVLAGVLRGYLIDSGTVPLEERSLTVADIQGAKALYVCNSVRGVVRVRLQPTEDD